MKKYSSLILLVCLPIIFFAFANFQVGSKEVDLDKIISQMTLEEKVGQMTNLTVSTILKDSVKEVELDMKKVKDVIVNHHIGSIQNVTTHTFSIDLWHKMIGTLQNVTLKETRMKIPFLYCIDAVHGANYTTGSTLFPHNLALAATRNTELVKKCAEITAMEVRASGIRYNFSPVLDVGRQPLWPRFAETFGEDVYLATEMGVASIKGYEGSDLKSPTSVASCMKHFVGYSVPASGRDRAPAYIPEIMLREYFLPTFKAAIEAGAHTLMVNSAEVNGVPVHASKYLLTTVLRNELGFKGMVISDWEDIKKMHERHRVADSHKEAVRLAVDAGIDMCIVPFDFTFYNDLIALVKEGKISEQRIDQSVKRILQLKKDLGLFENPYTEKTATANFGKAEYKEISLQAAREAVTLLKNQSNILPLKKGGNYLVVGPGSKSLTYLHGAWSYTWQGTKSEYFSKDALSVYSAIEGKAKPIFIDQKEIISKKNLSLSDIDGIVVCIGEDAYAETPGNILNLDLDESQVQLVKELKNYGKPMVLVLLEGRPRIIREIEPLADGIMMGYWSGPEGGKAVADVLFGDFNPQGKLPFTYPKYSGDIKTYDHKLLDVAVEIAEPEYKYLYKFDPQWEFGHGLSFTTFEYSDLQLSSDKLSGNEVLKVNITVKNTGKIEGTETVELYSRDLYASITPSVKRLRRFKKVKLAPGESAKVNFELTAKDLAFVNQELKWVTEPGDFEIHLGGLKKIFRYD